MGRRKAEGTEAVFGSIPFRALANKKLPALHLRLLGIIAAHDQMSQFNGGQGCWSGLRMIAARAGAEYTNAAAAISDLKALGYIELAEHPYDRRKNAYRVNYSHALDRAAFDGDDLPAGQATSLAATASYSGNDLPSDPSIAGPKLQSNLPRKPENQAEPRSTPPKSPRQDRKDTPRETNTIDEIGSAKKPASQSTAPLNEKQAAYLLQMIDNGQFHKSGAEQVAKRILASDALPSDLRDRAQTWLNRAAAEKQRRQVFRP